jgi:hypothetical protein
LGLGEPSALRRRPGTQGWDTGAKNRLLAFAAISEAATGLALWLQPEGVGQLLLGAELTGIGVIVARLAGIALLALAVACWPGKPLLAMMGYSAASALYLAYLGITGGAYGVLLWPAVVLHLGLTALLARTSRRVETSTEGKS